jgi:hypothetical protein
MSYVIHKSLIPKRSLRLLARSLPHGSMTPLDAQP